MIRLRLTSEYLAGPIFCSDQDRMGHIDIEDLPISQKLKAKIREWDDAYQATFNNEYPPDSGFATPDAQLRHQDEGRRLVKLIREELDGIYTIEYLP